MKTPISTILQHHLSIRNTEMDGKQTSAALTAMNDYAIHMVAEYRSNELKEVVMEGLKLFPLLWAGRIKLFLRKMSYDHYKKVAQHRADTENKKVYMLLDGKISYTLLSTEEVDFNKRVRKLTKDLSDAELTAKAAFVARPMGKTYIKRESCKTKIPIQDLRKGNYINTEYGIVRVSSIVWNAVEVIGKDGRKLWANKVEPIELEKEEKVHGTPVYYVHQKQNIHYWLTGKELEINL